MLVLVLVVFVQQQKVGKTLFTLSAATSSTTGLSALLTELPAPGNLTVGLVKVTHSASETACDRLFGQQVLKQRKEGHQRVHKVRSNTFTFSVMGNFEILTLNLGTNPKQASLGIDCV